MKKKAIFILVIIVSILAVTTIVNAANYSVGYGLTSGSKLIKGETVTINAGITSVNAGDGIDAFSANLSYDKSIFENVSIQSAANWNVSYNDETGVITALKTTTTKTTSAEATFTITMKVKSSTAATSAEVVVKDIVATGGLAKDGGTGAIKANSAKITISANEAAKPGTEEAGTNTPSGETPATSTKKEDGTKTKKSTLPKTGIGNSVVIGIAGLTLIAAGCYATYKKISKEVK